MSVLISDRRESKLEALTYSVEIYNMLLDLTQRNFGIKDLHHMVQLRYAYGLDQVENFARYEYLMHNFKTQINRLSMQLTNHVRAANSIYPKNLHECDQRRDFQNLALIDCEQLIDELQRVVETFAVDVNIYGRYVKAIDREIGLIKKWRQRDNRLRESLQGNI